MYIPLLLVVVGLVIAFASFVFAAVNMYRGVTSTDQRFGFGTLFAGHLGAMVGMALGGLISTIGVAWGAVDLLFRFIG